MIPHRTRLIYKFAILLPAAVLLAAGVLLWRWWEDSRRSAEVLEHQREYSEWKALTASALAKEHADNASQVEDCLKQSGTQRRECLADQVTWYSRYAQRGLEQLRAIESHFAGVRDRPLSAQVADRLRAAREFTVWLESSSGDWSDAAGDALRARRVQAFVGELRRSWQP